MPASLLSVQSLRWTLPLLTAAAIALLWAVFWHDRWGAFWTLVSSEYGVVENGNVALAWIGTVLAVLVFARRKRLAHPALGWWFLFFGFGLFLIGGEEASWGQWWFGYETPEQLSGNLQGEANLHNLSKATEQIPKNLLSLSLLVGGIIWPIYAGVTKRAPVLGGWFGWIWPDARLWPAAAIAWLLRIPDRVLVALDLDDGPLRPAFVANKETIEVFLTLYLVLYVISVLERMKAPAPQPQ